MISLAAKAARVFIPFLLLIVVGSDLGRWLAVRHYQPLLDAAYAELANAKAARGTLETLAGEQGRKLGALVLAGDERARRADQAVADAKELAKPDYAAANRLLQEWTGGDPAQAAAGIIDQELGL